MPNYLWVCPSGHETEEYRPVAEYSDTVRCDCGEIASISISTRLYARTFKPYIETGFDGKPIEITSAHQRDTLCKEHGLTYDKATNLKPPKRKSIKDVVTLGEVKQALETGRDKDGNKIERPVTQRIPVDKRSRVLKTGNDN